MKSNGSKLFLTRVRCTVPAAKCLEFTPDGSSFVVATHEGVVQLVKLDAECPQLVELPSTGYVTVLLRQAVNNSSKTTKHKP